MSISVGTAGSIHIEDINRNIAAFGYEERLNTGALDTTNTWTLTTGGTGSQDVYNGNIRLKTGTTLGSISAIQLKRPVLVKPAYFDDTMTFKKFNFEFRIQITSSSNVDESAFFIGLAATSGSTRLTNDIVGLCMNGGSFEFLADQGGSETTESIVHSVGDIALFKIVVTSSGYEIYKDGYLLVTIDAPLASLTENLIFYNKNDAAAETISSISHIRVWYDE